MHPEAVFYLDAVRSEIESCMMQDIEEISYNAGLDAAMKVIDRYLSGKGLYCYTSTDRKEPQESVYRDNP